MLIGCMSIAGESATEGGHTATSMVSSTNFTAIVHPAHYSCLSGIFDTVTRLVNDSLLSSLMDLYGMKHENFTLVKTPLFVVGFISRPIWSELAVEKVYFPV